MNNTLVSFGKSVTADMLMAVGINIEFSPVSKIRVGNVIEGPCSISTAIKDINAFGAFSYINGRGRFTNVSIGRYCSIAEQVAVGYPEHPVDWLSTSVLQYQRPKWSHPVGEWKVAKHESEKKTIIGNDVWIGVGVFIRSGVRIGNGAIIGAHAVVTKDVEAYTVVAGNPAKVIRRRLPETTAVKINNLAWWEFSPAQLNGCNFSSPVEAIPFIERLREKGYEKFSGFKLNIGSDGAVLHEPTSAITKGAM